MFSFLFKKLNSTTGGAALIVAVFSFLSDLVALFRERLLASRFGAGDALDVYYAAFRLPDFLFQTFILGALGAAFVPVFIALYTKDKKKGMELAASLLWLLILIMLGASVFLFFVAPIIIPWFVPGFSPIKQAETIQLTRIMLLAITFLTASNVFSATLHSLRRFVAASLAPILYNVGIIIGIIFFEPLFGLKGLAWGVVVGAILHACSQIPALVKANLRLKPSFSWNSPELSQVFTLMVPRVFSLAVGQLSQTVITAISSTLVLGSVAMYNLATNLVSVPVGIIGVSMAIASFPLFSQSVANETAADFAKHFSWVVRRILYMIIPITVLFILLRAQIVRLVYGAGKFTWTDTIGTFQIFAVLSLSLFAQALIPVLIRAFFAHQDTKTPVAINIIVVALQSLLAWRWGMVYGITGVAFAVTVGFIVSLLLFYIVLRIKTGALEEKEILRAIMRISLASLLMAVVVQLVKTGIGSTLEHLDPLATKTFLGVLIQGGLAGGLGLLFYIVFTIALRFPEVAVITDRLKK